MSFMHILYWSYEKAITFSLEFNHNVDTTKRQFLFIETVNHDKYEKSLNHDTDLYVNLSTSDSLLSMHRQTQIGLDFRQVNITYLRKSFEMFNIFIYFF